MTKREVVWLIVKLIGVYFIYEATMSAWSMIGSISALMSPGGNDVISREASSTFLRVIAWAFAMIAFNGLIGWYLIKDGSLLFQILSREEPPDSLDNLKKDSIIFSDEQNL